MNNWLAILTGLLMAFLSSTALSQNYKHFPGASVDHKTFRATERVEELYEKGVYERALLIYEKDLAPTGDKYAQYMVGYMYLTGKGVPSDIAAAVAWYRLAAERGEQSYAGAHEELLPLLDGENRIRSQRFYVDLRNELSDASLVAKLVEKDVKALRIQASVNSMNRNLIGRGLYTINSDRAANKQIVNRLLQRMDYLNSKVATDESVTSFELRRVEALEAQVEQVIEALGVAN